MRSLVYKASTADPRRPAACGFSRVTDPDIRDGEQKRDFLYIKDAVEMTLHFAEAAPTARGRTLQHRLRRGAYLA